MSIPAYTAIAAADDTDAARRILSLVTDDELKQVERYCIRLLWVCRDERWDRREGGGVRTLGVEPPADRGGVSPPPP